MTIDKPPENIRSALKRLTENGYAAYLVGGCVRDAIIGRAVRDWDIASSATPVDVRRLFKKTILTGERFGTVTVVLPGCTVEVTAFRTDGAYSDGRRPENVSFSTNLHEDLSRRDFTMNAMAAALSGELIDPFGGQKDIINRVIRCVGEPDARFSEDALRMFRALRFSAELGFDIEPEALASIRKNAAKAKLISAERIRDELEKTLLSQKPETAVEMIKTGLLAKYVNEAGEYPEIDKKLTAPPAEAAMRWSTFCAVMTENGTVSDASEFLRDMRLDAKTAKTCLTALSIGSFPGGGTEIKKLLAKHGEEAVRCAAAINDALRGGAALANTEEILSKGECCSLSTLAVSGSDLIAAGHKPGRELGKTLAMLLDHAIEHPEDNTRETLLRHSSPQQAIEEPAKI